MNDVSTQATVTRKGFGQLLPAALLVLLVLAVYLPSFRGGFVWDDALLIDQNPLVKGELTLRSVWFSTDFPLSNVALWLEWLAFGKNATGYRVVNAALHALSCVLLWRLLTRLKIPGGWLGAALFAVHPVAAGSVAWVSEIKNTLSLPLCLLSFGWFLDFLEDQARGKSWPGRRAFTLSLAAFVLALLAKTTVVGLPVVLLLTLWWQRGSCAVADLLKTTPHFLLALGFGLLTVWFQQHQTLAGFPLPAEGFAPRFAAAGRAVWFYLGKALWPLELCAIYPRWDVEPKQVLNFLPLVLITATGALGWWRQRTWGRPLVFGLGCFVAGLFPALGFFDMYFLVFSRVSDHFQYLALIVPLAAGAAGLSLVRPAHLRHGLAGLLLLAVGWLGVQRAQVFTTDETLWRDTLAKNPAAWNAHNNLGCLLAEKGDLAGARAEFEASIKLNPRNASAHCNLGKALLLKSDFAGAEKHFRTALQTQPNHVDSLRNYAAALAERGRSTEAVKFLQEAVQRKPSLEIRLELAGLLTAQGQDAEAVRELRLALAAQPEAVEALSTLAWILATSARDEVRAGSEAVRLAERARALKPPDAQGLTALAAAYAETGRYAEAVETAKQAIALAEASAGADRRFAPLNAQLLRLYQTGRTYHTTPRP